MDCINTATAFAYQDVFHSARDLLASGAAGTVTREQIEQHVLTLTMPQLIRHVQILSEAMRVFGLQAFVKVGTSGTGGMGLNIPYTHSEEKPSRTLLTKSAVAGAHSLLLFLLGRTPWAPATIEIKPTAAIAWREIGFGPIRRKGAPIQRYDCPEPLPLATAFAPSVDLLYDSEDSTMFLNYIFDGSYRNLFWILWLGGLWVLSVFGFVEHVHCGQCCLSAHGIDNGNTKTVNQCTGPSNI